MSTDSGPTELQSAVGGLLSLGPNLTPFLAEEMRIENDRMRLYQLVLLLNRVSGIKVYSAGLDENYVELSCLDSPWQHISSDIFRAPALNAETINAE